MANTFQISDDRNVESTLIMYHINNRATPTQDSLLPTSKTLQEIA